MEVKILVFETENSLNYWYKYIRKYLAIQQYQYFSVTNDKKIININNQQLRFITYPIENKLIGFRHSKVYEFLETRLEQDYSKTILEILEE